MSKTKKSTKRKPLKVIKGGKFGKLADVTSGLGSPAMMTMKEAVKRTGYTPSTLYNYMRDGRLPAFKVGVATMFRPADLDKLMEPVPYRPVGKQTGRSKAKKTPAKPKAKAKAKAKAKRGIGSERKDGPWGKGERQTPKRTVKSKGLAASELKSVTAMTGAGE